MKPNLIINYSGLCSSNRQMRLNDLISDVRHLTSLRGKNVIGYRGEPRKKTLAEKPVGCHF